MAQSFNIRPPEDVAFAYGFDKNRIAQAVADKKLDETSAVMAAMLINAGQRQQEMQAGQQPTVAQQVLGGGGAPAPLAANPAASAGMGALPPMSPPPSMPPQEMPQPEMAMAAGGLTTLPVPDAMFDEPTNGGFNDGYAGGGMVAFSNGGSTGGWGDYIEQTVRKLDPNIQIAGRARTPARNAEVGGVAGSYHLIDAARDITVPEGMKKSDFISQLKSVFGSDYDVLASKGNSVHVEPGPKLGEKVRGGIKASNAPAVAPERDFSTAEGRNMSMEDAFSLGNRFVARSPEQEAMREEARARFEEMRSPETYEKERKADMWQTLAEIGFNMASSKAPSVLQAIGEAASAALPGARADKKERKALKDRALQGLMQLSEGDEKLARDGLSIGLQIAESGQKAEQFERELTSREGIAERELNLRGLIAASKADGDGKKNTKADFIETFYQQFIDKGYQPNIARQYAFIAAEKALAKIKGTSEGLLFGDEEKTGGSGSNSANSGEDPFADFETVSVRN